MHLSHTYFFISAAMVLKKYSLSGLGSSRISTRYDIFQCYLKLSIFSYSEIFLVVAHMQKQQQQQNNLKYMSPYFFSFSLSFIHTHSMPFNERMDQAQIYIILPNGNIKQVKSCYRRRLFFFLKTHYNKFLSKK